MENHEKTTNSDEPPPEFEFGSLTPSSPSQDTFTENSPADHLFFNGRLLPHSFPVASNNINRSISRTTSEYTSRSNSMNSRSSCSSSINSTYYSPRTSCCDGNNNSPINHKPLDILKPPVISKPVNTASRNKATEMVTASLYRSYSSQRWQFITPTPAPVKMNGGIKVGGRKKKAAIRWRKKTEEKRGSRGMKWWRRILMAVIFACRECHALEGAA